MKKNTFNPLLILVLCLLGFGMNAQNSIWKKASSAELANSDVQARNSMPSEYQLFSLNRAALQTLLSTAPERGSLSSGTIIELPVDGVLQKFRVYEASVLATELQAQYPNIRSYAAQGIDDRGAIARFSLSPIGLHAMISSPSHKTVYIDPYTQDRNFYINYSRQDLPIDASGFQCLVEETVPTVLNNEPPAPLNADDGLLRTYRLALACTGEYATYHLNQQGIDPGEPDAVKKAAVLSAMNVAMTRVNGIYERDVAVTMVIVPNNTDIIFLNAATDPYTNNNGGTMLNQNQSTCDNIIGSGNYDIGHVFSTGGGGIAQLNAPCGSGKARGVTGLPSPINDPFYVDYVSHEMGHQFGANHTQNNNCQRSNRSVEPGSASTIMGYAGICPPNVQNLSDDYFHAISIFEMWNFVNGGGQCSVDAPTNNEPPTADAGLNFTIPKSTPFVLKGIGTDPEGDLLSYSWEQMDPTPALMPPRPTNTAGPAFRSIDPMTEPNRYMPDISWVLIGELGGHTTPNKWEVVPSVGRIMSFRFTVRDNVAGGAASASDNTLITVSAGAGPFVVTSQTSATTWTTQTTETITWDVANTDVAPVDSPTVDVLFSEDGGQTFPIVIASNIPNDGSAEINVPNVNTTTGRMMIASSNNIFYNVNVGVITVEGELATTDFTFDGFKVWPNPSNGTFNLSFKPASNDNIEVSLYDLRGRLISQNEYSDVSAGGMFNKALDYGSIGSGMYFMVVKNGNKATNIKLIKN